MKVGDFINVLFEEEGEETSVEIVSFDVEGNPIIVEDDQTYSTYEENGVIRVIPTWAHN